MPELPLRASFAPFLTTDLDLEPKVAAALGKNPFGTPCIGHGSLSPDVVLLRGGCGRFLPLRRGQ